MLLWSLSGAHRITIIAHIPHHLHHKHNNNSNKRGLVALYLIKHYAMKTYGGMDHD
jgi:hypothetical protein